MLQTLPFIFNEKKKAEEVKYLKKYQKLSSACDKRAEHFY